MPCGVKATIIEFSNGFIAGKLMAMGLLPGTSVELVRRSPFGNTLYIRSGNQYVALRDNEASSILVAQV
jgi:ferrous iron transport protein A